VKEKKACQELGEIFSHLKVNPRKESRGNSKV
jgi:hypothetical protein